MLARVAATEWILLRRGRFRLSTVARISATRWIISNVLTVNLSSEKLSARIIFSGRIIKLGVIALNLLILMNPAKHKDYTKILQTIDALGHNLIGFVRNDGVNNFSKNGDYVVYPFAHIQLLNYDVLLLDCYVDNMAELHSHVIKAGVPENKVRTINEIHEDIYKNIKDII